MRQVTADHAPESNFSRRAHPGNWPRKDPGGQSESLGVPFGRHGTLCRFFRICQHSEPRNNIQIESNRFPDSPSGGFP